MTEAVLAHRARVEELVGGRTLIDCLAGTADVVTALYATDA